jgi:hypothetical protein
MRLTSILFPGLGGGTIRPQTNRVEWITLIFVACVFAALSTLIAQQSHTPVPVKYTEPEWIEEKPLRKVENLGKVLSDIDSHMPAGHIYSESDRVGWGHETTHGIHSRLRNKHSKSSTLIKDGNKTSWYSIDRINCFYVLENRAIVLKEPKTTIRAAQKHVPTMLRGPVWHYMNASSWNNTPLYIFDEWVSYCNGAAVRHDLQIKDRSETVTFALEMNVYAAAIIMAANQAEKTSDPKLRNFFMWHTERMMDLYRKNGPTQAQINYLQRLRTDDTEAGKKLREFLRNYCGDEWTKKTLGF